MNNIKLNSSSIWNEPINVNYITGFGWEQMNVPSCRAWMKENWTLSFAASALYICLIQAGVTWMKNRPAFNLRKWLALWNLGLGIFSIVGFIRSAPELYYVLIDHGFHTSVCIRDHHNHVTAFWAWMMVWSKLIELGDTAFIILRKQKLIFLHWYHHITVLVYCWFSYPPYDPAVRYFMIINMVVHGIMYSYYALKAMKFNIPRKYSMVITICQLAQMVVGVGINLYSLWCKLKYSFEGGNINNNNNNNNNNGCDREYTVICTALGIYASYFILFSNFFYKSYFPKSKKVD